MKYKPEIDGLRALSILFVIFYHAKISVDSSQILAGGSTESELILCKFFV